MLTGSYNKRLDADLTRWVGEGLVSAESAATIRRSLARDGGFRLPALLGLFGGLLIASSVAAFVAANWEEIPRLMKLGMILAGIVGALLVSARLEAKGGHAGADTAATVAALIFGAGVALVGQMYHLPTDWPGGALLVALGALAVAFLMGSNGALVIALVAIGAWSFGRWEETRGAPHFAFFLLWLPALWLALPRKNRLVQHGVVMTLGLWLVLLPGYWSVLFDRFDFGLVAYLIAIATLFVAAGAAALDRGRPALATAFLPWGLSGLVVALGFQLVRILEVDAARAGTATSLVFLAYFAALAALGGLVGIGRERRFTVPLMAALLFALAVPLVFWSGTALTLAGKALVAGLVLASAIGLVVAGASGGVRRLTLAGSGLFAVAILILLWQTIGTLLDQSLFFLIAGAILIGAANWARKLFERLSAQREATP